MEVDAEPFAMQSLPCSPSPSGEDGIDRVFEQSGTQPISSRKLLHGRASVTIDHEGTQYILRATRAGKLILTK